VGASGEGLILWSDDTMVLLLCAEGTARDKWAGMGTELMEVMDDVKTCRPLIGESW